MKIPTPLSFASTRAAIHSAPQNQISREGEDESEEESEGLVPPQRRLGAPRHDGGVQRRASPRKGGLARKLEARRKLAVVVEAGIEQAKLSDPDINAKDEDIRLLSVSG